MMSDFDGAITNAILVAPPDARTDQVIDSIVSAWRDSGGDPRVGASLPPLMERCGLRVEVVEPVVRIARPGTPLWGWPRAFFDSFLPGLVAQGRLSPHALEEFDRRWAELERIPGACFHSPPMVRIVARKR